MRTLRQGGRGADSFRRQQPLPSPLCRERDGVRGGCPDVSFPSRRLQIYCGVGLAGGGGGSPVTTTTPPACSLTCPAATTVSPGLTPDSTATLPSQRLPVVTGVRCTFCTGLPLASAPSSRTR